MTEGSSGSFNLSRVMIPLVIALLAVVAAVVFFGFYEGYDRISKGAAPPIVAVRGRVLWKGEPLATGVIATSTDDLGYPGGLAEIKDGEFVLATDINGRWIDGLHACEHRVTVARVGPPRPAAAPDLLTPRVYQSFSSTPLRIKVDPDPAKNVFEIVLEGEADPPPTRESAPPPIGEPDPAPDAEKSGEPQDQP